MQEHLFSVSGVLTDKFPWLQNTAGTAGVKSVSVRTAGTAGAWVPMNNAFGADWEMPASPAQPLDIQVISDDGSSVSIPRPFRVVPPAMKLKDIWLKCGLVWLVCQRSACGLRCIVDVSVGKPSICNLKIAACGKQQVGSVDANTSYHQVIVPSALNNNAAAQKQGHVWLYNPTNSLSSHQHLSKRSCCLHISCIEKQGSVCCSLSCAWHQFSLAERCLHLQVVVPSAVAAGYTGTGTAPGQNFAQDAVGQITAAVSPHFCHFELSEIFSACFVQPVPAFSVPACFCSRNSAYFAEHLVSGPACG